ncbi:MAG: ATP-dependent DNA ligase [Cyanobium sp.]
MEAFCQLFRALDESTGTAAKVEVLLAFFRNTSAADAAWALHVLLGRQKRRLITGRRLRDICVAGTDLPPWLFDECHRQVGDSAETISLLWGPKQTSSTRLQPAEPQATLQASLQEWMEHHLPALAELRGESQVEAVHACWQGLNREQLLVVNKLLTGGLRVGVSEGLVIRALYRLSGLEPATLKHRLMGGFSPTAATWEALLRPTETGAIPSSRPYPFFLASPLDPAILEASCASHWQVEWKYDGIRCQLIHRRGEVFLWSRGEDLINASFPDLSTAAAELPDGLVLDGEVVVWAPGESHPRPFAALQRRLGRLAPGRALLQDSPARYVIYDLLEEGGEDQRGRPLHERRQRIQGLESEGLPASMSVAPVLPLAHWDQLNPLRDGARQAGAEGVMLKNLLAPYLSGRKRGHWWKHKLEPYRLDAVLLYAQAGCGRRANLFTDYTFGLWERPWSDAESPDGAPRLVTFAKAYSGLDDKEILRLDQWIRRHTLQRFGPVRAVQPELVFELAFEGIQPSPRHKSGLAVRFPRISRWRLDKVARQADSLVEARALMACQTTSKPTR